MSVFFAERTWPEIRQAASNGAVVVVPLGATEQHGPHLPLETDWRLCTTVAERACQRAAERGVPALVTPPLWTGYSPHHMDFAGTVTLDAPTFMAVVVQVARSLWHHEFRKILLLNGHGGNSNLVRSAVQELRFEHDVRAAAANYWDFVAPVLDEWRRSAPGGIDHACEMETSLMLALRPELVHEDEVRDAGWMPRSQFLTGDLAIGAPVSVAWSFAELSDDGTLGDAAAADAERGRFLLDAVVDRVASFVVEMQAWDWDQPRGI